MPQAKNPWANMFTCIKYCANKQTNTQIMLLSIIIVFVVVMPHENTSIHYSPLADELEIRKLVEIFGELGKKCNRDTNDNGGIAEGGQSTVFARCISLHCCRRFSSLLSLSFSLQLIFYVYICNFRVMSFCAAPCICILSFGIRKCMIMVLPFFFCSCLCSLEFLRLKNKTMKIERKTECRHSRMTTTKMHLNCETRVILPAALVISVQENNKKALEQGMEQRALLATWTPNTYINMYA